MPRFSHPSARLALKPCGPALPVAPPDEVASCPAPASSGSAGDRSSSCPDSRVLQHIRRISSGLPRSLAPPVVPVDASPGCPGFCIFRPCRRSIFESPRISHPSAHPAPKLASLPAALLLRLRLLTHSTSCPASCIFRLCRRRIPELPRVSRPSVPLVLMLRVSPRHCSSSCASRCVCGFPRSSHLPALPRVRVSGLPRILSPLAPADGFPSCLGSRILRLCRPCVFELPRILHLRLG